MADTLQMDTAASLPQALDEGGVITECGTEAPPSDDIPNQSASCTASDPTASASSSFARRATVGLTGGLITAVGLVMIPAPTPFGCVVAAYGASILATEFEGAQDVLEGGKKKLHDGLKTFADKLQENDEHHTNNNRRRRSTINSSHPEEEHEEEGEEVVLISDEDADDEEEESSTSEPLSVNSINQSDEVAAAGLNPPADISPAKEQSETEEQQSEEVEVQANGVRNEDKQEREEADDDTHANSSSYADISEVVIGEQDVVNKAQDVWRLHSNNMRKVSIHTINNVLLPALRDLKFRQPTRKTDSSDDDVDQPSDDAGDKGNENKNDDSQRTEATLDETVYGTTNSSSEDEEDVPGSAESVVSISTVEDKIPLVAEALHELVEALKEEPSG